MNKEILTIKSYYYDIVEFKNDQRTYKRYESGFWVELYDGDEYYVRDSELEEVYQEYLKKKENK